MEKYKKTLQKQKTQSNSSNVEWWVGTTNNSYSVSEFKNIFNISLKSIKHQQQFLLLMFIYINRINNRLVFKMKDGYKL